MVNSAVESEKILQSIVGELFFWCGRIEHQVMRLLAHMLFSDKIEDKNFETVEEIYEKTPINVMCRT